MLIQVKDWLEKASEYAEAGDYDNAISSYTSAISINPNNADAYFNRARVHFYKKQYDNVIADCSKAILLDSNVGSFYFVRGITYNQKGNYEKAIEDFSKNIELTYELETAYFERADAYSRLKQYDKSAADNTKVISINPDNLVAYSRRGNGYIISGEYKKAIADLTYILERNPDDIEALSSRGIAYAYSGDNRAMPDLMKASEMGDEAARDLLIKLENMAKEQNPSRQTYYIFDFLKVNEISISPDIQEREVFPFTMDCAQRLFDNFRDSSFEFDGMVKAIVIFDGKENLPRQSYAHGFLFSQTLDEIGAMSSLPKPLGKIELEYGGSLTSPIVRVDKK
jgi:tetratricopeptide (TPR) repeat protein